ncbi:hypothetical protein DFJ73DRAFT_956964 [Zopfochytrium polystomum]|nr:hypothetical protein DFJ73DRAFT_956964 [Zopfochytrium polystomum]
MEAGSEIVVVAGDAAAAAASVASPNGRYHLALLEDGNLVLLKSSSTRAGVPTTATTTNNGTIINNNRIAWSTNTASDNPELGFVLALRGDGNLCLYQGDKVPENLRWSTDTWQHGEGHAYRLSVQDDGNIILRKDEAEVIWESNPSPRILPSNVLKYGETMRRGDALVSPSGQYRFVFEANSDIALYDHGADGSSANRIWSAKLDGAFGDVLKITESGSFDMYTASGSTCRWSTSTNAHGKGHKYHIAVEDEGRVALFKDNDSVIWEVSAAVGLFYNTPLCTRQTVPSPSGRFHLVLQEDGDLVLWDRVSGSRAWSTSTFTCSPPPDSLVLKRNGDLCLYAGDKVCWSTDTGRFGEGYCYCLMVQDDGNIVLHKLGDAVIWESNPLQHFLPSNVLERGATMKRGDTLVSPNGRYRFVFEANSDLALYEDPVGGGPSQRLWTAKTDGLFGNLMTLEANGHFRMSTSPKGKVLWSSNVFKHGTNHEYRIMLEDTGRIVTYKDGATVIWEASSAVLCRETAFKPGESLTSLSGQFQLTLQRDGDLVMIDRTTGSRVWATNTTGFSPPADLLVVQEDGNVVLYTGKRIQDNCRWATNKWPGAEHDYRLCVGDDGNIQLIMDGVETIWETKPVARVLHSNILKRGESLRRGESIVSPSGRYRFVFEANSELVLYDDKTADGGSPKCVWSAKTSGRFGERLTMQEDGNLCMYTNFDECRWSSYTWGHGAGPDYRLELEDTGRVALYKNNTTVIWQADSDPVLPVGVKFHRGETLPSPSGRFQLFFQKDGDLVLWDRDIGARTWTSNTGGVSPPTDLLLVQKDGNLCLYAGEAVSKNCRWSTATWVYGLGKYNTLSVHDDGNIVLFRHGEGILWQSTPPPKLRPSSSLLRGEYMQRGEYMVSPNGRFRFVFEVNSNLCLYDHGESSEDGLEISPKVVWSAMTEGQFADRLTLQDDGNICMFKASGKGERWASNTDMYNRGHDYRLSIEDVGRVALYLDDDKVIWEASGTATGRVRKGSESTLDPPLRRFEAISSPSLRFHLLLQQDGDLILWDRSTGTRVWSSNTANSLANSLTLRSDGTLSLYADLGGNKTRQCWTSGGASPRSPPRSDNRNYVVCVQDDGRVVVLRDSIDVVWSNDDVAESARGDGMGARLNLMPRSFRHRPAAFVLNDRVAPKRLVNLHTMRVERRDEGKEPPGGWEEYAAVSYVWGYVEMHDGSKYGVNWPVPHAAIEELQFKLDVCRDCGYKYAWVDVLCLNQGSDEQSKAERYSELPLMGSYYEHARGCFAFGPPKEVIDVGDGPAALLPDFSVVRSMGKAASLEHVLALTAEVNRLSRKYNFGEKWTGFSRNDAGLITRWCDTKLLKMNLKSEMEAFARASVASSSEKDAAVGTDAMALVVSTLRNLLELFARSDWFGRIWTFQECLLPDSVAMVVKIMDRKENKIVPCAVDMDAMALAAQELQFKGLDILNTQALRSDIVKLKGLVMMHVSLGQGLRQSYYLEDRLFGALGLLRRKFPFRQLYGSHPNLLNAQVAWHSSHHEDHIGLESILLQRDWSFLTGRFPAGTKIGAGVPVPKAWLAPDGFGVEARVIQVANRYRPSQRARWVWASPKMPSMTGPAVLMPCRRLDRNERPLVFVVTNPASGLTLQVKSKSWNSETVLSVGARLPTDLNETQRFELRLIEKGSPIHKESAIQGRIVSMWHSRELAREKEKITESWFTPEDDEEAFNEGVIFDLTECFQPLSGETTIDLRSGHYRAVPGRIFVGGDAFLATTEFELAKSPHLVTSRGGPKNGWDRLWLLSEAPEDFDTRGITDNDWATGIRWTAFLLRSFGVTGPEDADAYARAAAFSIQKAASATQADLYSARTAFDENAIIASSSHTKEIQPPTDGPLRKIKLRVSQTIGDEEYFWQAVGKERGSQITLSEDVPTRDIQLFEPELVDDPAALRQKMSPVVVSPDAPPPVLVRLKAPSGLYCECSDKILRQELRKDHDEEAWEAGQIFDLSELLSLNLTPLNVPCYQGHIKMASGQLLYKPVKRMADAGFTIWYDKRITLKQGNYLWRLFEYVPETLPLPKQLPRDFPVSDGFFVRERVENGNVLGLAFSKTDNDDWYAAEIPGMFNLRTDELVVRLGNTKFGWDSWNSGTYQIDARMGLAELKPGSQNQSFRVELVQDPVGLLRAVGFSWAGDRPPMLARIHLSNERLSCQVTKHQGMIRSLRISDDVEAWYSGQIFDLTSVLDRKLTTGKPRKGSIRVRGKDVIVLGDVNSRSPVSLSRGGQRKGEHSVWTFELRAPKKAPSKPDLSSPLLTWALHRFDKTDAAGSRFLSYLFSLEDSNGTARLGADRRAVAPLSQQPGREPIPAVVANSFAWSTTVPESTWDRLFQFRLQPVNTGSGGAYHHLERETARVRGRIVSRANPSLCLQAAVAMVHAAESSSEQPHLAEEPFLAAAATTTTSPPTAITFAPCIGDPAAALRAGQIFDLTELAHTGAGRIFVCDGSVGAGPSRVLQFGGDGSDAAAPVAVPVGAASSGSGERDSRQQWRLAATGVASSWRWDGAALILGADSMRDETDTALVDHLLGDEPVAPRPLERILVAVVDDAVPETVTR